MSCRERVDALIEQARYVEARAILENALNKPPPDEAALRNALAHVLFAIGLLHEALEAAERAVALDPTLAMAHRNLGYLYADLRRPRDAEAAFSVAIDLEPGNARPRFGLGLLMDSYGDTAEAERGYRAAIARDPEYVGPRACLAYLVAFRRRTREREFHLSYASRHLDGQRPFTRALFAAAAADHENAFRELETCFLQAPGYRRTARYTACFAQLRQDPRVRELWEP